MFMFMAPAGPTARLDGPPDLLAALCGGETTYAYYSISYYIILYDIDYVML